MSGAGRPHVICHMMGTIDGRILTERWPDSVPGGEAYEAAHATFGADAWMCGRRTMEEFADGRRPDAEVERQEAGGPRDDHEAPGASPPYAVAIDGSGRLRWRSADVDGDHVIAVLTERVSDDSVDGLRKVGVSYVFAGERTLDLALALRKLHDLFGVRTLALEGGGGLNGSMLRAGLVDEVSLLVVPVADGERGAPSVFDAGDGEDGGGARRLSLTSVERRDGDVLWLRYRVGGPG